MAFPAFIAALPVTPLFELAGETTGGTTHHITNTAYLENEMKGAKELTRGLTQAPANHLDRVFRGNLSTEGAMTFTQPAAQRPASPIGPRAKGPTHGL